MPNCAQLKEYISTVRECHYPRQLEGLKIYKLKKNELLEIALNCGYREDWRNFYDEEDKYVESYIDFITPEDWEDDEEYDYIELPTFELPTPELPTPELPTSSIPTKISPDMPTTPPPAYSPFELEELNDEELIELNDEILGEYYNFNKSIYEMIFEPLIGKENNSNYKELIKNASKKRNEMFNSMYKLENEFLHKIMQVWAFMRSRNEKLKIAANSELSKYNIYVGEIIDKEKMLYM